MRGEKTPLDTVTSPTEQYGLHMYIDIHNKRSSNVTNHILQKIDVDADVNSRKNIFISPINLKNRKIICMELLNRKLTQRKIENSFLSASVLKKVNNL